MQYTFFYDKATEKERLEHLSFRLSMYIDKMEPYSEKAIEACTSKKILLFLSDEQLKNILPQLAQRDIILALLPHPDNRAACTGLGVDFNLDEAIEHILTEPEPVELDFLYCNKRPVFNNLVIGQSFQLATSKTIKQLALWPRIKQLISSFFNLRPFHVQILTPPDKEIKTTVSGIVIVQHGKSSLLSRLMIEDSFVNDGKFHAFFISPRSVAGLFLFAVRSWRKQNKLPPYASHIKTNTITLVAKTSFEFAEDGISTSSQKLEIRIEKSKLQFIPGLHLNTKGAETSSKEIFRTSSLPKGETALALAQSRLPLIEHASTEEFKDLFQVLRDNSKTKSSFLVLMVLSTLLATFGLFANSSPVVIGAMILAPLMSPIISLSMGALRQDTRLTLDSINTILAGLGFSVLCAIFVTWLVPLHAGNEEIISRTRPNLLDLGIAVVSGIAGAYAHAREEVAKTLAGVAIAVALVPPLAVAGIGIGELDWEIFYGATLLLFTNLGGIVLAGSLTFLFLGFSPFHLAKKGVLISAIVVLVLAVPLGFGFYRMMYENNIVQQLENWQQDNIIVKDVAVQRTNPLMISIKLVSNHTLSDEEIDVFKKDLQKQLNREVEVEVTLAVRR